MFQFQTIIIIIIINNLFLLNWIKMQNSFLIPSGWN